VPPLKRLAVAAVTAAMLAVPASASAHANVESTTPGVGSVVPTSPEAVQVHFDQEVRPVAGGSTVVDKDGNSVTAGEARTSPSDVKTLLIPLQSDLPDGDYTVRWKIVSTDGHIEIGIFAFGVGVGRPPPQTASIGSNAQDWRYTAARAAYFAGLLVLVGGAIYRLFVFLPATRGLGRDQRAELAAAERPRANQVLMVSAVLALVGGWMALTVQGATIADVGFWRASLHQGAVASALDSIRFGREFSRGISVTAAFTVLVALAYAVSASRRGWLIALFALPAAALGLWSIAIPGLSGHAGDPGRGVLTTAVDAAHVLAAAIWAGGLVQLFWVTPRTAEGAAAPVAASVRSRSVARFSKIALACVVVVAATGVARALWEVGAVSELWTTEYGKLLLAKSALLLVLIGLGYRNRQMLSNFPALRRSVGVEIVLMGCIVAVVAVLTGVAPANTAVSFTAGGAAPAAVGGGGPQSAAPAAGVRIDVWPGYQGTNAVAVRLAEGSGKVTVAYPTSDGESASVPLKRVGGWYTGWMRQMGTGKATIRVSSDAGRWSMPLTLGSTPQTPGEPPPVRATGPLGAGRAGDLMVALQRIGDGRAQASVVSSDSAAVRDAMVEVDGALAPPCSVEGAVCYTAPIGASAHLARVRVLRPTGGAVPVRVQLPAAAAPSAARQVARATKLLRSARSVATDVEIVSPDSPVLRATTVMQAPDRLQIEVAGGPQTRVIGATEYDRNTPTGDWTTKQRTPVRMPNAAWTHDPVAAYVAGTAPGAFEVTLGRRINGRLLVYQLVIDRATGRVTESHAYAPAVLRLERYRDWNSAPPIVPPS
jgi:copper transport protein